MRTKRFSLAATLSILLFNILACDDFTNVNGKVVDENGKPIKEAKVVLNVGGRKWEGESQDDGYYTVGGNTGPFEKETKIIITKEGYHSFEEIADSQKQMKRNRQIILKKK